MEKKEKNSDLTKDRLKELEWAQTGVEEEEAVWVYVSHITGRGKHNAWQVSRMTQLA